jgi:ankyrin repeat protein
MRLLAVGVVAILSIPIRAADDKQPSYPSFEYEITRKHEIKPHRRTIPLKGAHDGLNQLHLTLVVSENGDVLKAEAGGDKDTLKFWPQVQDEVLRRKFAPFETDGKNVTAEVEEYIDLVPPERLPTRHVAAPDIRPNSKIAITLQRTGCYGTCPSYSVELRTDEVVFEGSGYVVATGVHRDRSDPDAVRKLAKEFVAANFYSMNPEYEANITDNPTYILSINIDGHEQKVVDYVGEWVGMPAVIRRLEDEVDTVARTDRWIEGAPGLVDALQSEKFDFKTFLAQRILKQAILRGQTTTVRELLLAGVPLEPLPNPHPKEASFEPFLDNRGLLQDASRQPETLQALLKLGVSRTDQSDKDLALVGAAESGNLESVRALIAYGANPNADLGKITPVHRNEDDSDEVAAKRGAGSILMAAAESGNPEVVREILRGHPNLEVRDNRGQTAIFRAGDSRDTDKDGARVECVRLLAEAGANVNARDVDGNTPLHETFLTAVEEELLKAGADLNARNNNGETPIFTTGDDDAIPLFIAHGADLAILNKDNKTVVEAAKEKSPSRQEALRKAIEEAKR